MDKIESDKIINSNTGYCPICEKETVFVEISSWLRDGYLCNKCKSIPRMRALVRTLNRFVPGLNELSIHEPSSNDLFVEFFSNKCKDFSHSKYFPGIPHGSFYNNIRCENLECLTYPDNSFDVFITQDVLEHVMSPQLAFNEIARVLKPGGYHIFTVPIYEYLDKTSQRVNVDENDALVYLFQPEYHVDDLVIYHYSMDIIDKIGANMLTTVMLERDRHYGIDGEFLHVFACKKLD